MSYQLTVAACNLIPCWLSAVLNYRHHHKGRRLVLPWPQGKVFWIQRLCGVLYVCPVDAPSSKSSFSFALVLPDHSSGSRVTKPGEVGADGNLTTRRQIQAHHRYDRRVTANVPSDLSGVVLCFKWYQRCNVVGRAGGGEMFRWVETNFYLHMGVRGSVCPQKSNKETWESGWNRGSLVILSIGHWAGAWGTWEFLLMLRGGIIRSCNFFCKDTDVTRSQWRWKTGFYWLGATTRLSLSICDKRTQILAFQGCIAWAASRVELATVTSLLSLPFDSKACWQHTTMESSASLSLSPSTTESFAAVASVLPADASPASISVFWLFLSLIYSFIYILQRISVWAITFSTYSLPTWMFGVFSTSLTFTMNFTTLCVPREAIFGLAKTNHMNLSPG